jgi:hypothetical protein
MREADSNKPARRRVDGEAKAIFVAALRAGAHRDEAAKQAGFASQAFYYARQRDPLFKQAWLWALELSAADERFAAAAASPGAVPGEYEIAPNANRRLQRRPVRRPRFDDKAKRRFLDFFAGTADVRAAAKAAGVSVSAVTEHRLKDPEFDGACEEVLGHAYKQLRAEALRQRLEAQRKLREGICPAGEMGREFERVIQLLDRYERQGGMIGTRAVGRGRERRMSFDEAMVALDKRLRALGLRHGIEAEPIALPPPRPEDGDRDEDED